MSYSACDFMDDVLGKLEEKGMLPAAEVERLRGLDDAQSEWATLALQAIERFAPPPPPKTRHVCAKCGSDDVWADAFASINNPHDVRTYDDLWCQECEAACTTTEVPV